MRNTWLAEQLQSISEEPNSFIIEETIKYIEQLEDDNESLQVALERMKSMEKFQLTNATCSLY